MPIFPRILALSSDTPRPLGLPPRIIITVVLINTTTKDPTPVLNLQYVAALTLA